MDSHLYIEGLRHRLLDVPEEIRLQKLQIEFSRLVRSYLTSKQSMQEGHLLDAFSCVLESLSHWARIVILEEGLQPEARVWAQVRRINPGVYKLYEELISNEESLEQRLKLVLLACEFSMMTKMENCCSILINVIKSREAPWSVQELEENAQLKALDLELPLLIAKMSRKQLIREIAVSDDESLRLEMRYTVCT